MVYHDPRGSGGSEAPLDPGTLNVAQYAADLDALRAHLGLERFALIGHSHGGLISLHYAIHYPGRVTHLMPVAAQLVGHLPTLEADDVVPELCKDPAFARALQTFQEGVGAIITGELSDDEATAFMRRVVPIYFKDQRHAAILHDFLAHHKLSARTMRETSLRDGGFPVMDRAQEILAPTLVLAGKYDILCPSSGENALARAIPGAKLALFEKSAHFPWVEEADAFFDTVRGFLAPELAARQ